MAKRLSKKAIRKLKVQGLQILDGDWAWARDNIEYLEAWEKAAIGLKCGNPRIQHSHKMVTKAVELVITQVHMNNLKVEESKKEQEI